MKLNNKCESVYEYIVVYSLVGVSSNMAGNHAHAGRLESWGEVHVAHNLWRINSQPRL